MINLALFLFRTMSFSYFSFISHHQMPFSKTTPFHLITVEHLLDISMISYEIHYFTCLENFFYFFK